MERRVILSVLVGMAVGTALIGLPTRAEGVAKTGESYRVTVHAASFGEAVRQVADAAGMRVVVDGELPEGKYSLQVNGGTVEDALRRLLSQAPRGSRWEYEIDAAKRRMLLLQVESHVTTTGEGPRQRLQVYFRNVDLRDALAALQDASDRKVHVGHTVPGARVTLRARDLNACEAVRTVVKAASQRVPNLVVTAQTGGYRVDLRPSDD